MKIDKRQWERISRELNKWSENDRGWKGHVLKVEQTGFFPLHVGARGANHNESRLVEFTTRIYEAEAIYFAGGANEYSTQIYVRSTVHSEGAGTYIEISKGGKRHRIELRDNMDKLPWQWERVVGPLHEFLPEGFAEYCDYARETNETVNIRDGRKVDLSLETLQRQFAEEKYTEVTDLFQEYQQREIQEQLVKAGFKVHVFFRFTHSLGGPGLPHFGYGNGAAANGYVKRTRQGIELGWRSAGTYSALPCVIKVTRCKGLSTVKLADLGIETSGYYDHHVHHEIPKDQAKAARAFFARRFKRGGK